MDRPVGSGYGSGLYILTRSHIYIYMCIHNICVCIRTYIYVHAWRDVRRYVSVRSKKSLRPGLCFSSRLAPSGCGTMYSNGRPK